VDLDADATAFATREALDDLAGVTTSVRVLGSYARGARGWVLPGPALARTRAHPIGMTPRSRAMI
jgi:hypothetical protein